MYCSIFDRKSNNTLDNIVKLTSTSTITSLDSKKVTTLLTSQKQHANAIYEALKLLNEKGEQNRSQDWIDETIYYCGTTDVYTLLSLDNTITILENAPLLDRSILPVLREKSCFSQQDFNNIVRQAIAKGNIDNPEETISPLIEEDGEMTFLLNKKNL